MTYGCPRPAQLFPSLAQHRKLSLQLKQSALQLEVVRSSAGQLEEDGALNGEADVQAEASKAQALGDTAIRECDMVCAGTHCGSLSGLRWLRTALWWMDATREALANSLVAAGGMLPVLPTLIIGCDDDDAPMSDSDDASDCE